MMAESLRFAEAVAVKVEPEVVVLDDDDDDYDDEASAISGVNSACGDGGYGGGFGSAPKSMEAGPPPFLSKTFAMVDDPDTDAIISWGATQRSFVVWDPHKFSTDLLPQHFKHSNFSSFIRQLNTYRFRKIDSDKWEFANEGFQKGKKHLLKNIKRRKQNHHQHAAKQQQEGGAAELQKLRVDHTDLKMEVIRLKQQQQTTESHLGRVKEQLEIAEARQKRMLLVVAKVLKSPPLFRSLVEKMKDRSALRGGLEEPTKKRRLGNENAQPDFPVVFDCDEQEVKDLTCESLVDWEDLMEGEEMIYESLVAGEEEKQFDIVHHHHQLEDDAMLAGGDLVAAEQGDCPILAAQTPPCFQESSLECLLH